MAQTSQQFTPTQILEAGRRAEVEGRIEYAIQFYRHLTDHLPRTIEAASAREALSRLGAASGPGPSATGNPMNGNPFNSGVAPGYPMAGAQSAATHAPAPASPIHPLGPNPMTNPGPAPRAPAMMPNQAAGGALIVRPGPGGGPGPAPDPGHKRKLVLPKTRRRYRTGRVLARAFTLFGVIEVAVGLLFILGGLLGRIGPSTAALPEFLASQQALLGGTLGLTLVFFGLILVLGGQLSRAIFDTASANRDLAAYARARAAFENGIEDKPPQD